MGRLVKTENTKTRSRTRDWREEERAERMGAIQGERRRWRDRRRRRRRRGTRRGGGSWRRWRDAPDCIAA